MSYSAGCGRLRTSFAQEICSCVIVNSLNYNVSVRGWLFLPGNAGKIMHLCSAQRTAKLFFYYEVETAVLKTTVNCCAMSGSCDIPLNADEDLVLSEVRDADPIWPRRPPRLPFWEIRLIKRVVELTKRRQLHQVLQEIEAARKFKGILDRAIMNAALEACVHCRDITKAMQIFDEMLLPDSCGVDGITYGTVIKGLGEAGRLDNAFQIIESMETGTAPGAPPLSLIHLNTLINACANAGDARRATAVLLRYRSLIKEPGPPLLTYNILIKSYARSEIPLEALKALQMLKLAGLQPDIRTLNTCLLACVRGGDMSMASEIAREMKEEYGKIDEALAPNVITYTTLIKGHANEGDIEGVLNMAKEMKASPNCKLDRVAYTAIIDACITAGSLEDGWNYFRELEELGKEDRQFRPRVHAFLALCRAFAEIGDVDVVTKLKYRMVYESSGHVWLEHRIEADELLIEAAVNNGQFIFANQKLKDMLGFRKDLPLSSRGYAAIVRLQAMTNFDDNIISPYMIREEISVYAPITSIISELAPLNFVSEGVRIVDIASRFLDADVLPVVDGNGYCIGVLHSGDCSELDALVKDNMRKQVSTIPVYAPILNALRYLSNPDVKLLVVVASESNAQAIAFLTKQKLFSCITEMSPRVDL